jgi:hypothetical protein
MRDNGIRTRANSSVCIVPQKKEIAKPRTAYYYYFERENQRMTTFSSCACDIGYATVISPGSQNEETAFRNF